MKSLSILLLLFACGICTNDLTAQVATASVANSGATLEATLQAGSTLALKPAAPEVLSQKNVGDLACGPCSIFNAFQFGDATLTNLAGELPGKNPVEKVKSLIATYGGKNSALFHHKPRYTDADGMWNEDMAPFINDCLKHHGSPMSVSGKYLTLQTNETAAHHLARIHDLMESSIKAGFPPVLGLESYAAQRSIINYHWTQAEGHFVTIVRVQPLQDPDAPGFSMWVADSTTGRTLQAIVYAERNRPFSAVSAARADNHDHEEDTWSDGYPFLLILSPELEDTLSDDSMKWHRSDRLRGAIFGLSKLS